MLYPESIIQHRESSMQTEFCSGRIDKGDYANPHFFDIPKMGGAGWHKPETPSTASLLCQL